jgi:hypothetical protein
MKLGFTSIIPMMTAYPLGACLQCGSTSLCVDGDRMKRKGRHREGKEEEEEMEGAGGEP